MNSGQGSTAGLTPLSKILIIDIETSPTKSYHWRTFKENIGVDQIIEPGEVICFAAKWLDSKHSHFYSNWEDGHEAMIKAAHDLLSECDAVVHVNGKKFDIPHLMTEFALLKLGSPPPLTQIDVQQVIRSKFRLVSNKLAFIGPFFKIGAKMEHEGFMLWRKVMDGDTRAQNRMKRYCIQDMKLTERVYKYILPFISNHPHMGKTKGHECGACGSAKLQSRGYRRTKSFRIQRMQCQNCGSWMDGKREKMT